MPTLRRALAALLFFCAASAWAWTVLDPQKLAAYKAKIISKVAVFSRAQQEADKMNARVAVYGGSGRELDEFVQKKIGELGSEAAFETWLNAQAEISLVDWHKLNSDLDVMLIPNKNGRVTDLILLRETLGKVLPGSTFYRSLDIVLPHDFYQRFPVQHEHFEAISNVPISHQGLERLEEFLTVDVPGRGRTNLAEWGLEQMATGRFDFVRNPHAKALGSKGMVYQDFKQVLRWIRYYSQFPDIKPSAESRDTIQKLLRELSTQHKGELLALLKSGDRALVGSILPNSDGAKIVDALEKLQLYSADSAYTHQLLQDFGIVALAEEAGVAAHRILKPVALRKNAPSATAKRLGKEVTIFHYGNIQAVQSMAQGALWKSDNEAIIKGKPTSDMKHQGGIYGQLDRLSAGHGGGRFAVEIKLNPEATLSTPQRPDPEADLWTDGSVYVIRTRNAIAQNADRSLGISPITFRSLLDYHMDGLLNEKQAKARDALVAGLADLLEPETYPAHADHFAHALANLQTWERENLLRHYYARPSLARVLLLQSPRGEAPALTSLKQGYLRELQKNGMTYERMLMDVMENKKLYAPELIDQVVQMVDRQQEKTHGMSMVEGTFVRLMIEDSPARMSLLSDSALEHYLRSDQAFLTGKHEVIFERMEKDLSFGVARALDHLYHPGAHASLKARWIGITKAVANKAADQGSTFFLQLYLNNSPFAWDLTGMSEVWERALRNAVAKGDVPSVFTVWNGPQKIKLRQANNTELVDVLNNSLATRPNDDDLRQLEIITRTQGREIRAKPEVLRTLFKHLANHGLPEHLAGLVSWSSIEPIYRAEFEDALGKALVKAAERGDWPSIHALSSNTDAFKRLLANHPRAFAQALPLLAEKGRYGLILEQASYALQREPKSSPKRLEWESFARRALAQAHALGSFEEQVGNARVYAEAAGFTSLRANLALRVTVDRCRKALRRAASYLGL